MKLEKQSLENPEIDRAIKYLELKQRGELVLDQTPLPSSWLQTIGNSPQSHHSR